MGNKIKDMLRLAGFNESANYAGACGWLVGGIKSAKGISTRSRT